MEHVLSSSANNSLIFISYSNGILSSAMRSLARVPPALSLLHYSEPPAPPFGIRLPHLARLFKNPCDLTESPAQAWRIRRIETFFGSLWSASSSGQAKIFQFVRRNFLPVDIFLSRKFPSKKYLDLSNAISTSKGEWNYMFGLVRSTSCAIELLAGLIPISTISFVVVLALSAVIQYVR